LGFRPSKAEEDIWMRNMGDHYAYLASYVDDMAIASRNPQAIIDALEGAPNNFKLKGMGVMEFHLGCDSFRDKSGTLCVGPQKYIKRMVHQYKALYGEKPSNKVTPPLRRMIIRNLTSPHYLMMMGFPNTNLSLEYFTGPSHWKDSM
jgi:hypothetical protein